MSTPFSKNNLASLKENYSQKLYIILIACLALVIGFQIGKNADRKQVTDNHSIELIQNGDPPKGKSETDNTRIEQEKVDVLAAAMKRKNFTIPSGVDLNKLISSEEKVDNHLYSKKNLDSNFSPEKCPFVASKNSDKYHRAECSTVARIKKENRICFSSEKQAQSENYTLASDCTK